MPKKAHNKLHFNFNFFNLKTTHHFFLFYILEKIFQILYPVFQGFPVACPQPTVSINLLWKVKIKYILPDIYVYPMYSLPQ